MIYTHGQSLISRPELHKIAVPERDNVSKNWQGVNHGVLADTIVKQIEGAGLGIRKETWYCNPDQSALFGAVDIDGASIVDTGLDIGQDGCFSLGVRHDNKGKYAVSFAVGGRITVCSNGVFTGDFVLKHRHFKSLDLDATVADGIKEYINQAGAVEQFINSLRAVEIDDKDAAYLIMQAGERIDGNSNGCLNWAHLRDVYGNWIKPPHEEFAPRTQWSLYNAFTEVAKELTPPRQLTMFKGLRPIMESFGRN